MVLTGLGRGITATRRSTILGGGGRSGGVLGGVIWVPTVTGADEVVCFSAQLVLGRTGGGVRG